MQEVVMPLGAHLKVRRVAALLDKSERWVKQQIEAGKLEGFRAEGEIIISERSINNYLHSIAMAMPSDR